MLDGQGLCVSTGSQGPLAHAVDEIDIGSTENSCTAKQYTADIPAES